MLRQIAADYSNSLFLFAALSFLKNDLTIAVPWQNATENHVSSVDVNDCENVTASKLKLSPQPGPSSTSCSPTLSIRARKRRRFP